MAANTTSYGTLGTGGVGGQHHQQHQQNYQQQQQHQYQHQHFGNAQMAQQPQAFSAYPSHAHHYGAGAYGGGMMMHQTAGLHHQAPHGAAGVPMVLPQTATHRAHHPQPILPAAHHSHQTLADANAYLLRQHHQEQQRHFQQQQQQQLFQQQQQQAQQQLPPDDHTGNETQYPYAGAYNYPPMDGNIDHSNQHYQHHHQQEQQLDDPSSDQKQPPDGVTIGSASDVVAPKNPDNSRKETQFDKIWITMFEKLLEYKREHGDCLVPKKSFDYPKLGNWVNNQRALWRAGRLTEDRKERLDDVGFVWCARFITEQKQWDEMYMKLKAYCDKHGDCQVPQRFSEDPKLAHWVYNQRQKEDVIPPERKAKLESIGFQWKLRQLDQWETLFEKLVEFKQKFGHCRVPTNYKDDPKLGTWVSFQRTRRDHMTDERFDRLDKIGFVWSALETWPAMFDRLVEYQKKHHHCKVPTDYKRDPKLGQWVQTQRNLKERGMLATDRKEKLKSLGFSWRVRKKSSSHHSSSSPSKSPAKAAAAIEADGDDDEDHQEEKDQQQDDLDATEV